MSNIVINRDQSCRVAASRSELNNSYLVPRGEAVLIDMLASVLALPSLGMLIYIANDQLSPTHFVHDVRNGLALRADLD